jgi:hypothetical protein
MVMWAIVTMQSGKQAKKFTVEQFLPKFGIGEPVDDGLDDETREKMADLTPLERKLVALGMPLDAPRRTEDD